MSASRLQAAREYLGFSIEEISMAMKIPAAEIKAMEDGAQPILPEQLERFSRIYAQDFSIPAPTSVNVPDVPGLTASDSLEVQAFAQFLRRVRN